MTTGAQYFTFFNFKFLPLFRPRKYAVVYFLLVVFVVQLKVFIGAAFFTVFILKKLLAAVCYPLFLILTLFVFIFIRHIFGGHDRS